MARIAPYGSWESPISAESLTAGQLGLSGGTFDGDDLYWAQARPDQGGRTSLWRRRGGEDEEITPDAYVRTMVHEYGGGAWAVRGGIVVYSTFPSHQVFALIDGEHRALTPDDGTLRYADFVVRPDLGLVLCVREDHRPGDLDCVNEIVALSLNAVRGGEPDEGSVVVTGSDFYAAPRLDAAGTSLAWVEWDHPNMPWDSTRLMVASLAEGAARRARQIAGTPTSAPCHPLWHDGSLVFLDDPSGFWNFYRYDGERVERLHDDDHDYCPPAWVFGGAYALAGDGRIVCTRLSEGDIVPGVLAAREFTPLAIPGVCSATIGGTSGSRVVVVAGLRDRATELGVVDLDAATFEPVRRAFQTDVPAGLVSVAEAVTWDGPQGVVHAWYYPPVNPDFAAPEGDLPPLRVRSHGGPTGMARNAFALEMQYWTSRGWAILDVNYGGSAGFGRAYRERLQGQWGVVDVRDCADGARVMVERGLAHPRHLAIEGGSAGGYTTLAALTTTDTFTAGNCLYGIADLMVMCAETHKFESRYLFGLIGGTPEDDPERYRERSPLFHLDRLSCPMLIQQGADDRVVPPNQATLMADAVRAKGLPVALVMFEGEGHGWRKASTIVASVEAANSFFAQVFGYDAVGVPRLAIDNL